MSTFYVCYYYQGKVAQPWDEIAQPRGKVAQPCGEFAQPRSKVAQRWSEVAQPWSKIAQSRAKHAHTEGVDETVMVLQGQAVITAAHMHEQLDAGDTLVFSEHEEHAYETRLMNRFTFNSAI